MCDGKDEAPKVVSQWCKVWVKSEKFNFNFNVGKVSTVVLVSDSVTSLAQA